MDLREQLLQQLVTPQAETRFGDPYLVAQVAHARGVMAHEVEEELWGLLSDGLAYISKNGQGSGTDNWSWRASRLGVAVATGSVGAWEPRDPTRYLQRLKTAAPDLDEAAINYVREALRAFNARCYLATSVMLGVASEQVFGRLASAFVRAQPGQAGRLDALLSDPSKTYFKRFEEFRKRLEPQRRTLPPGLADPLTLDAIADLLRVARNEAGHPTGEEVDEDTAYAHLTVAASYLIKMTKLALEFENAAPEP